MTEKELAESINQLGYDVRSLNDTATTLVDQLARMSGTGRGTGIDDRLERIEGILNDILHETSQ